MDENKKSSKRFLVIYCIAIFAFAVALILIASASQARITREADAIRQKLTDAEIIAADSKTRLDAVMTENSRLKTQLDTLTIEVEALKTEKEENANKLTASQKLSELLGHKLRGRTKSFKTALSAFKTAGYEKYLSPEDLKLYNSIK
ncbi:MAG: hypothetical protein IKU65_01795 [Oscillospiraceae bacterium]|nr:hypothetical protein [Oscillospiraceae bacterium]